MTKQEKLYTVKTLEKAIDMLLLFNENQPELSLKDISRALQMPKATAFRLVYTLEKKGFLQKNYYNGTYQLGLRLFHLGSLVTTFQGIGKVARPYLYELSNETDETVELAVLDGNKIFIIDKIDSKQYLKASDAGKKLPLHCTASGKILTAYAIKKVLNWPPKTLEAYTDATITDPTTLLEELEQVRKQGYALDKGELSVDVRAVSAPIRNNQGTVLAALTIVAPASRIKGGVLDYLIKRTMETADQISEDYGYIKQDTEDLRIIKA